MYFSTNFIKYLINYKVPIVIFLYSLKNQTLYKAYCLHIYNKRLYEPKLASWNKVYLLDFT